MDKIKNVLRVLALTAAMFAVFMSFDVAPAEAAINEKTLEPTVDFICYWDYIAVPDLVIIYCEWNGQGNWCGITCMDLK